MDYSDEKRGQRGSAAILAAVGAVAVLGVAAVVMDVGYMMVTRAELQNVADVAAHSANLELGRIYDEHPQVDPAEYTLDAGDKERIEAALNSFAQQNKAANQSISIRSSDVFYGRYDRSTGTFEQTDTGVTGIQVMARRDEQANGMVSTLMSSFLGLDEFGAAADAGAAIAPAYYLPAGKADFPVGIAKYWFDSKDSPCGTDHFITFYPTGSLDGCAGWHTFESWPANASKLKDILEGLENGTFTSPDITVGETQFAFSGGTVASALQQAKELYEAKKDGNGEMLVHLPVYDADDCANPNGWIRIVGIATARITGVVATGHKKIDAHVECDIIGYGEGGGPDYGTYVGRPDMME